MLAQLRGNICSDLPRDPDSIDRDAAIEVILERYPFDCPADASHSKLIWMRTIGYLF